jgi:hypothetical protein
MNCAIATSCSLCACLIGVIGERTVGEERVNTEDGKTAAKQLLSANKEVRSAFVDDLTTHYDATASALMSALGDAVSNCAQDHAYRSPLHCAILAVARFHVLRADRVLLSIVDYQLDADSLPVGVDFAAYDYFPAAAALLELRVDTHEIVRTIKTSQSEGQLRLLTWLLLRRAAAPDRAKAVLEDALRTSNGQEMRRLQMSKELLPRGERLVDLGEQNSCAGSAKAPE